MIVVIAYTDAHDNDLRQVTIEVKPEDTWKDSLKKAADTGLYGLGGVAEHRKANIESLPTSFYEAQKVMRMIGYQVACTLIDGDPIVL